MNGKAKPSTLVLLATSLVLAAAGIARAAASPAVITGSITDREATSALLHGTVNPNGAATSYVFEWGPTSGYGSSSPSHRAGRTGDVSVQAKATGLLPGTIYHYRLSAASRLGGTSGKDRTFRTEGHPPPGATTGSPAGLGLREATLTGTVDPNGETTAYSFQYGLTSAYGLQTAPATVPAGSAPVPVSTQLSGLAPGTVFHYRIVASHGHFASYGADATLVTLPLRQQRSRVKARTSPRRSHRRPHIFTTTGSVTGGSRLPAQARCQGSVAVGFIWRGRRLAFRLVPLGPECTFSVSARIRHLPRAARGRRGLRLAVAVRFRGNDYLTASRAHSEHVLLIHRKGR
jgi:hypothetical protein